MKFRIFASLMILSLIFTSGCIDLEYIYHTKINKDGSILRRVQATGDSTDVYENPFPFNLDSTWSRNYSQTVRDTDSVYMIEVHRTFADIEELNGIYATQIDSSQTTPITVELEKSFQWFYTYFSWVENLPQQFPFGEISVDSFLSKDELRYWSLSDTTILQNQPLINEDELEKEIDKKLDQFTSKAIFENFFEELLPFAREKGMAKTLISKKMKLFENLTKPLYDQSYSSMFRKTDEILEYPLCEEAVAKGLFKTFSYKYDHMFDELYAEESFKYFLECPGNIVDGNASVDSNEVAYWQFHGNEFIFHNYEMKLEYRTPNYWAFVVTAVVLLFLLWFIVRTGRKV